MKTELMNITPAIARQMLECNTSNRPLRPGMVEKLAEAYRRGEWRVTHQGIAFSEDGRLLDGQHRLTFISELPDGSEVPVLVTAGLPDDAFDAIDQGKPRSIRDVYGTPDGLVAVGRFYAGIAYTKKVGITPQMVKPFLDWAHDEYDLVVSFSPGMKKFWSSAAIRSAAIYQVKRGHDSERIRVIYDSLIKSNIGAMTNGARVFTQQYLNGIVSGRNWYDTFCRALRVFNTKEPFAGSKILVREQGKEIAEVRDFLASEMKKSPGNAGQVAVKPSAKFTWKKAA